MILGKVNTQSYLNPMVIWPSDRSSFANPSAQKLFSFSSMANKYLHKSKQEMALFHVICWSGCSALRLTAQKTSCCCLESLLRLSPPQHVHIQPSLNFLIFWKELGGNKIKSSKIEVQAAVTTLKVKIFWGWLLIEGSWEISMCFLGKQRAISKWGFSESRKPSNGARLAVSNQLSEHGKKWYQ